MRFEVCFRARGLKLLFGFSFQPLATFWGKKQVMVPAWCGTAQGQHPGVARGLSCLLAAASARTGTWCKSSSCSLQLNEVFKHIPGCHKLQQTKFR